MILRSSNGWSANDRGIIASYQLPGGRVALRKGDVSVVLLWCANRWHETVEPLVWPGVWGYAERLIRGSSTMISNHASGTAIDINAPAHPLGTDPHESFSTLEIRAIRAILEHCDGVVRWGGDYIGRRDPMHLEINASSAAVRRVADKIRAPKIKNYPAAPLPVRSPTTREDDCVLIKSQPDKTKPVYVSALLSGPMFVGLGPTETPSDDQAHEAGIAVLWVEYATYQELDRRSHALCDNPRPVVTQSPVVRAVTAQTPVLATTTANRRVDVVTNVSPDPTTPGALRPGES